MSSLTTVIDAAPRPAALSGEAALAAGSAADAARARHSRSCPARQIGGACEAWCRAFPCPAWCTGSHGEGNRVYHLAAQCPSGCSGHPNWDTEADLGHAGLPRRQYLEVCVCPAEECPAEACRAGHADRQIVHVLVGDSDAARSARA